MMNSSSPIRAGLGPDAVICAKHAQVAAAYMHLWYPLRRHSPAIAHPPRLNACLPITTFPGDQNIVPTSRNSSQFCRTNRYCRLPCLSTPRHVRYTTYSIASQLNTRPRRLSPATSRKHSSSSHNRSVLFFCTEPSPLCSTHRHIARLTICSFVTKFCIAAASAWRFLFLFRHTFLLRFVVSSHPNQGDR
ncbi:hypothetical protein IQ06DRAFT_49124 [Phaeosphaeriaceae sp. SRC1lsM3a]|nr:hypothetical protein IQ06DRAFT_49124 [Stagonospora sp. SRC1lsM3a]